MAGASVTLRNGWLNSLTTALDAGAGAGLIRGYNGTQPATGGTATTMLFANTLSKPSAPAASGGSMTENAITGANAVATGTYTWARMVDSAGTFVVDLTSAEAALLNPNIVTGQPVQFTSGVFTAGNP